MDTACQSLPNVHLYARAESPTETRFDARVESKSLDESDFFTVDRCHQPLPFFGQICASPRCSCDQNGANSSHQSLPCVSTDYCNSNTQTICAATQHAVPSNDCANTEITKELSPSYPEQGCEQIPNRQSRTSACNEMMGPAVSSSSVSQSSVSMVDVHYNNSSNEVGQ